MPVFAFKTGESAIAQLGRVMMFVAVLPQSSTLAAEWPASLPDRLFAAPADAGNVATRSQPEKLSPIPGFP